MTTRICFEGSESQRVCDTKLQKPSSQWIQAIHGRHDISVNGGIEELQNVFDTLINLRATSHAGISVITAEPSVGRDHVLTHLPSSIVEDQNSVTGLRTILDRSSPLERSPSGCLIASTERQRKPRLNRTKIWLNTKIKTGSV